MRFGIGLQALWLRSVLVLSLVLLLNACASTGMDKDDKDFRIADTNLRLGVGYMRQGRYEDALEKLQKAVAAKHDYADVHSALALVYERLLEYDKAGQTIKNTDATTR